METTDKFSEDNVHHSSGTGSQGSKMIVSLMDKRILHFVQRVNKNLFLKLNSILCSKHFEKKFVQHCHGVYKDTIKKKSKSNSGNNTVGYG